MSTLIALAYKDEATSKSAMAELKSLQKQHLITIEDGVIAHNDGGKIKLDQALNVTGAAAAGGALWGGLFGLIFLVPVVNIAVGAAAGALAGKFSDYGIDDDFARDMQTKLAPGKAALVLLVRHATPDKVLSAMKQAGLEGEIIQTNLSGDAEQKLKDLAASV